jgi:hypothetical protein
MDGAVHGGAEDLRLFTECIASLPKVSSAFPNYKRSTANRGGGGPILFPEIDILRP